MWILKDMKYFKENVEICFKVLIYFSLVNYSNMWMVLIVFIRLEFLDFNEFCMYLIKFSLFCCGN